MFKQETAETIALQVLAWLVGNDELLPVFLGSTGASLSDLAQAGKDPGILGSVLDFVLMDDAWVVACCDALGLPYDSLAAANALLSGRAGMNWT